MGSGDGIVHGTGKLSKIYTSMHKDHVQSPRIQINNNESRV